MVEYAGEKRQLLSPCVVGHDDVAIIPGREQELRKATCSNVENVCAIIETFWEVMAMAKAFLLFFSLSALLSLWGANTALGDIGAQLQQAEGLTSNGNYEQAEQLYQQIVANNPSTDYGLEAQEKLTCLYVAWGREPQIQAGLRKLFSDFSQQDGIDRAVTHVADAYRQVSRYIEAIEIYGNVVARWQNSEHGMWSQMGLAISHASLADDVAAESAYERLRTQYAANQHISRAICLMADNYRRLERSDKARGLYEYVLANWPTAEFALWSRMGVKGGAKL